MSQTMSGAPRRTIARDRGPVAPSSSASPAGAAGLWLGALVALAAGGLLGALTDLAQTWLPWIASTLANSGGAWVLVSFLVALTAGSVARAVARGGLSLLGLVIGYYLMAAERGVPVAGSSVRFWVVAALVIGPVVGLAAGWVRHGTPWRVAVGAGVVAGLLVGEGVHGLRLLYQSTSSVYWGAQILIGLGLMLGLLAGRARRPSVGPLALLTAFTVGAGTVAAFVRA